MRGLRVLLLGQGRLEFDGQPLTRLMAAKQQALVFHLAASGEPAPRSRLAALLWGEHDEAAARTSLRAALTRLRRWLPGMLDIDERQVGFAAGAPLSVDWHELAAALRDTQAPLAARDAAAALWRGPLLDGLDVVGSDEFERWLAQMRQRAQHDAVALRRELLQRHEAQGALEAAIGHARGLLEIDESDEPAHMALMRLLAARGQRTAALAQYEACRAALAQRLGARPSALCYALYTRIHAEAGGPAGPGARRQEAPAHAGAEVTTGSGGEMEGAGASASVRGTAAGAPAPAASPAPTPGAAGAPAPDAPAAEPAPALLGREAELALLAERLGDAECRWLTITGPGGVGKTRLAQAAAARLAPRFRHGALWFSGRDAGGALRDAESLAQQVLERVGADRHARDAVLLVLDNLETVPQPRSLATVLARRLPGAVVLATSRTRVGGAREWLLELGGLSLARAAEGSPASSPAAQLFEASARRLLPGFRAADHVEAVDRLCERVGGLPLALEMAARAVHRVGLAAVAERLDAGAALADPDRDEDDRHHSIELVLEDSWALLDAATRTAAVRLAWLPAEVDAALAGAIGVGDAELARLRDHSWLQPGADARVAMHPVQQDYLRRRPGAAGVGAEVRSAVARHLAAAMPPVAPFGELPAAEAERARRLAAQAACAPPLLAEAAAQQCAEAALDALVPWIDAAVALLRQADRTAEAAALLRQALGRADLPRWLATGWGLRRAELLCSEGNATEGLAAYAQALAGFGLGDIGAERADWASLPGPAAVLLARRGWPPPGPAREPFERLLLRGLFSTVVYLTFGPALGPAMRLGLLADLLSRRIGALAELRRVQSAWALASAGRPALAGRLERRLALPRERDGEEPMAALRVEGQCALRLALGRWSGLPALLDASAERWAAVRNVRHEVGVRSLGAKLAFYEGRLAEAAERFAAVSELSLRRPGEWWRAWGPMGQAEVGLCLGQPDDATLQRWYERGSRVMTEMEDVDAAYTLRRLGLAARLAWRRSDVARAREAVLAGCAAAARLRHCGFWAHEGYAALGDVLLALRRHERERGGALPPLDEAWRRFEPALRAHVRRFPPAAALCERLRAEREGDDGGGRAAVARLRRAVALAERQGARLELARACETLARLDRGDAHWRERAGLLWQDLRRPAGGEADALAHGAPAGADAGHVAAAAARRDDLRAGAGASG